MLTLLLNIYKRSQIYVPQFWNKKNITNINLSNYVTKNRLKSMVIKEIDNHDKGKWHKNLDVEVKKIGSDISTIKSRLIPFDSYLNEKITKKHCDQKDSETMAITDNDFKFSTFFSYTNFNGC